MIRKRGFISEPASPFSAAPPSQNFATSKGRACASGTIGNTASFSPDQSTLGGCYARADLSYRADRGDHGNIVLFRIALMSISAEPVAPVEAGFRYIKWAPIILGAVVAAALSSIL